MSARSEYLASGGYRASENQILYYEHAEKWDGKTRLIIATHGHGGDATQMAQSHSFYGRVHTALAATGRYVVLGISDAGPNTWSAPDSLVAINDAVTWARNKGARAGKYGLLGYSMGGLVVANQIKRDHANIAAAWTYAPAIDLDWVYGTAGHVPNANNATWTSEVNAAFGSYAATAGYRVWDEPASYRGLGVPWRIAHATDDNVVPPSVSTSFVAAVNDPLITMRTPDFTGGHTTQFQNIPDSEIVGFFDSASW